MIRLLAALLLCALPAVAQEPVLRADIDETAVIPGQAVSLRLTVLVPSFLPDPPLWPSYEAPNLLVRVASTGPVSERIDGATWPGVSRRYLIAPMVPGPVNLPAQEIVVTWADPETNAPRRTVLATVAITITGIVPEGAEALDPFLAADAVTLEQIVEGTPEGMVPGDSLSRTVIATIEGTSPMFLPPLLPEHAVDGLRAYPDAPVFEETSARGAARGTRTERVTLVAEGGGSGVAPEVTLDWYNLVTGTVEMARLPAFSLSVDGPPAATVGSEARDWRAIGLQGLAVFGLLAMCLLALRYMAPPLKSWFHHLRADWMDSETRAWRGLCRVVRARDYTALWPALELWAARIPGPNPRQDVRLSSVLTAIGGTRYGNTSGGNASSGWRELNRVLKQLRREARHKSPTATLQPLNPRT